MLFLCYIYKELRVTFLGVEESHNGVGGCKPLSAKSTSLRWNYIVIIRRASRNVKIREFF